MGEKKCIIKDIFQPGYPPKKRGMCEKKTRKLEKYLQRLSIGIADRCI